MKITDKDRPSTWIKYQDHFCKSCQASCCTMPVEVKSFDIIRLGLATEDEINHSIKKTAKRLKKEGVISSYRDNTDLFMITQKSNDDCYFLDPVSRHCKVYERRPDTCRDFPSRIGTRVTYCPYKKK